MNRGCELQVTSCRLQAASYKLQVAGGVTSRPEFMRQLGGLKDG